MHIALSKSALAIEAVLYVACNSGAKPVKSKDICDYLGISLRHLEQLLQQMTRKGLLKSIRGPRGGYVLAKERRKISLDAIVNVAMKMQEKQLKVKTDVVIPLVDDAHGAMVGSFGRYTIEDLFQAAQASKSAIFQRGSGDFSI